MTLAEAACPAKPGILERSFPWCLSGRGYCMLPNSSMSQRRHVALCVCRLVACYSDNTGLAAQGDLLDTKFDLLDKISTPETQVWPDPGFGNPRFGAVPRAGKCNEFPIALPNLGLAKPEFAGR